MRTLSLILITQILLIACQKEIINNTNQFEFKNVSSNGNSRLIQVCHFDGQTCKRHTITISESALPAHLAHGDVVGDCSEAITTIGNQDWTVRSLDAITYRNGDTIPQVTDPSDWVKLKTGAWCYLDNDPLKGALYGKLYNGYAVKDPRGLAPVGWHIPSEAEWSELITFLGGPEVAGGKMKSAGNTDDGTGLWFYPNAGDNNSSGFTALPGGNRGLDGYDGVENYGVTLWSSTESNSGYLWYHSMAYYSSKLYIYQFKKIFGFYVRCIKDNDCIITQNKL